MPNVTVAGAGGATVTLSFDSAANALLARSLAGAITAGVKAGTILPASSKSGLPPVLPPGKTGEWLQQTAGATILPAGYRAIVNTASKATILGTGEDNATVLSSTGGFTFFSGGGSGTVVAGGGDNRIVVPAGGSGAWSINTGAGDDTIQLLGTGNDTVRAGTGRNVIQLAGGHDQVISEGTDRITLGAGSATILATGAGKQEVFGGSGSTMITGGWGDDTFIDGLGDSTIFGGPGEDIYSFIDGISGGHDVIYGFNSNDHIDLSGYGESAVANALASQTNVAGGVQITLANSATVTFMGLSQLTAGSFSGNNEHESPDWYTYNGGHSRDS